MGKKKRKKKKIPIPKGYDIRIYTDGACAGNPGEMGIGCVIKTDNQILTTFSDAVGYGTNNEAEYLAIIQALKLLKNFQFEKALLLSDSQLAINQINGDYSIKQHHLYILYAKVKKALKEIKGIVHFQWISRNQNSEADALASAAVGMPMAKINSGKISFWEKDNNHTPNLESLPEVKPDCQKQIERLLLLGNNAKFKDFMALKSGGIDKYSRISNEKAKLIIALRFGNDAVKWLEETLVDDDNDYAKKTYRWCARGLEPDLALKKVSVDLEIANKSVVHNFTKSQRRGLNANE